MNSTKTKSKKSKIQKSTNNYILLTMLIQFVLSLSASLGLSLWTYYRGQDYWYIYPGATNQDHSVAYNIFINSLIWFVALMNFVPVSLLVTLEMVNFI